MKDLTRSDLQDAETRIGLRCNECGKILSIEIFGGVVLPTVEHFVSSVDTKRHYCMKCAYEYANQRDLDE